MGLSPGAIVAMDDDEFREWVKSHEAYEIESRKWVKFFEEDHVSPTGQPIRVVVEKQHSSGKVRTRLEFSGENLCQSVV